MTPEINDVLRNVRRAMLYVSVPGVVALACTAYMGGYLHGWFVYEGSGPYRTGVAFLIAIIVGFLFRVPYRMWKNWLDAQPDEELAHAIMHGLEQEGFSTESIPNAGDEVKQKSKNEFDQNDFD